MSRRWLPRAFVPLLFGAIIAACDRAPTASDRIRNAERAVANQQWQDAIVDYKNALQLAPGDAEVRLKLARIYFTVGDMDRARAEIEKARALGRIDQETTYTLLRAMQMGERAEAMASVINGLSEEDRSDPKIQGVIARSMAAARDIKAARPIAERLLTTQPQDGEASGLAHLALAEIAQIEGDFESMERHLLEIEIDHGVYPYGQFLLADEWSRRLMFDKAEGAYANAIKRWPNHVPSLVGITQAFIQLHQFEKAERHLNRLREVRAKSVEAYYLQGLLAFARDEAPEKIIAHMREVLKQRPNFPEALLLLSDALIREHQYEQAIVNLQQYLSLRGNDEAARKRLAESLLRIGQPMAADAQLRKLSDAALSAVDTQLLLATAAARLGKKDVVLEILRRIDTSSSESVAIEVARGYLEIGDFEQAYQKLTKMNATTSSARLLIDDLILRSAIGVARIDEMLHKAEKRLNQHPQDPAALIHAADANFLGGDPARAAELYGQVTGPGDLEARALIGLAKIEIAALDFSKAEQHLKKARTAAPTVEEIYLLGARAEDARGNPATAVAWLRSGVERCVPGLDVRLMLARKLVEVGSLDEAFAYVEQVRARNSTHREASLLSAELLALKRDFPAAISQYKSMIEQTPANRDLRSRLLKLQLLAGQDEAAENELSYLKTATVRDAGLAALEADFLLSTGEIPQARSTLEDALKTWPEDPSLHVLSGDLDFASGAYLAALNAYRVALELQPDAKIVQKIAGAQRALGDRSGVIQTLSAWLEDHPGDGISRALVAVTYREMDKPQQALEQFESLFKHGRKDAFVAVNLAELLQDSDPARALKYAVIGTKHGGSNSRVLSLVARLYLRLDKVNDALPYLRRAAKLEQGKAVYDARLALIETLLEAGRDGEGVQAIESLQRTPRLPDPISYKLRRLADDIALQSSTDR